MLCKYAQYLHNFPAPNNSLAKSNRVLLAFSPAELTGCIMLSPLLLCVPTHVCSTRTVVSIAKLFVFLALRISTSATAVTFVFTIRRGTLATFSETLQRWRQWHLNSVHFWWRWIRGWSRRHFLFRTFFFLLWHCANVAVAAQCANKGLSYFVLEQTEY